MLSQSNKNFFVLSPYSLFLCKHWNIFLFLGIFTILKILLFLLLFTGLFSFDKFEEFKLEKKFVDGLKLLLIILFVVNGLKFAISYLLVSSKSSSLSEILFFVVISFVNSLFIKF